MIHAKKSLAAAFAAAVLVSASVLFAQQKTVTVEGYVLDSACAFTKNLEKPIQPRLRAGLRQRGLAARHPDQGRHHLLAHR